MGIARRRFASGWAALCTVAGLGGCIEARPRERAPSITGPLLRILGTMQDGGLPHPACSCSRCASAAADPALRRNVVSLGLVGRTGSVALVDATPDIRDQLATLATMRRAAGGRPAPDARVDRMPIDALFVTHAHMGHYAGLAQLGFEAVNAEGIPTHVTESMADFLRGNGPWDQLVRLGNLQLSIAPPGQPVEFDGITVTPLSVPHRREYTDTVGYRIAGSRRTVLYIPDCAPWSQWPTPPEPLFAGVDVALVDGTFFSMDELPGRDVAQIGHPLMTETMERLAPLLAEGMAIGFTHLNHSNPALSPRSASRREIEARGFSVLADGLDLAL